MPNIARRIPLVAALALCLAALLGASASAADKQRYIVVLKDTVDAPGEVAREHAGRFAGEVGFVYRHALKGYSVKLPASAVAALERDPRVRFVSRDHEVGIFAQSIPTGIDRTFATDNGELDIDGVDDVRVDADVAVLDTGVDFDHPDLNVVGRTNCTTGQCVDGTGDDGHGHGTHVAGTVGAIDNGQGVVGIAPGARLWGVKVLSDGGSGQESWIVAGVDWATAHASQIEVVNMSLGCVCSMPALAVAITNSVDAGVVYAVAAGNFFSDAANFSPANHLDVITVSALADFDGLPGGAGGPTCRSDVDDTLADFSNWGAAVEVAAPGVCILSTWKNGGYNTISGTSMASPHVAGAAAFLASRANPANRADVMAIRQRIVDDGNFDWTDDSGDGIKEPLLDVRWSLPADSDVDGDRRADLVTLHSSGETDVFLGRDAGFFDTSDWETGGLDQALFDGRGDYVVDVSDVDGDFRADLVTWGHAGGVSVSRSQPDSTFAPKVTSLPEKDPSWDGEGQNKVEPIGVADVNGDGRGDLVARWNVFGDGMLETALGQADGTFGSFTDSVILLNSALFDGVGQYFVDVADVSGDGRADLVSMGTSGSASVFKGRADGTFQAAVAAASIDPVMDDGQGHEPVGLGDVNLDGRADLLTLDGSGSLNLYKGKADATFEAPTSPFAGTVDSSLLDGTGRELVGLLDYNGDGRADLVAIDAGGSGPVFAYRAQSNGTFAAPSSAFVSVPTVRHRRLPGHELASEKPVQRRAGCTSSGCAWRSAPAESDVNGDGRSDLMTLHSSGSGNAFVFSGLDAGIETSMPRMSLNVDPALLDGVGRYVVDVSDVDGNGRSDLVTWGHAGGVTVYGGDHSRGFLGFTATSMESYDPSWDGEGQNKVEPIGVADVNGDGRGDLVWRANIFADGILEVALGQADGTFRGFNDGLVLVDSALFDGVGQYFVDVADVSGDGRADLVSMGTSGSVSVFKGRADGTFEAAVAAASIDPVMDDGQGHEPVGLGDVNLDGRADLLTLDGSGSLNLYKGKADATFEAPTSPFAGTVDSSLLDGTGRELVGLLDYNGDGRADLVAIDDQGVVWNYRAGPDGTFGTPTSSSGGTIATVRHSGDHEPGFEKVIPRRVGCTSSGCAWPPGS